MLQQRLSSATQFAEWRSRSERRWTECAGDGIAESRQCVQGRHRLLEEQARQEAQRLLAFIEFGRGWGGCATTRRWRATIRC